MTLRFNIYNLNASNKIYLLYDAIEIFYRLKTYNKNKLKTYNENNNLCYTPKTIDLLLGEYLDSYCREFLPLRLIAINPKLYSQKVELHPASIDDFDEDDIMLIKLVFPELGESQVIKVEKNSDRMLLT